MTTNNVSHLRPDGTTFPPVTPDPPPPPGYEPPVVGEVLGDEGAATADGQPAERAGEPPD